MQSRVGKDCNGGSCLWSCSDLRDPQREALLISSLTTSRRDPNPTLLGSTDGEHEHGDEQTPQGEATVGRLRRIRCSAVVVVVVFCSSQREKQVSLSVELEGRKKEESAFQHLREKDNDGEGRKVEGKEEEEEEEEHRGERNEDEGTRRWEGVTR